MGIFYRLSKEFYPLPIETHLANTNEPKSNQLLRLLEDVQEEFFILLEEDFWLMRPVSLALLTSVFTFCIEHKVDRFSLQSINAYAFPDWKETTHLIQGFPVYATVPQVQILFSTEASIWKTEFLWRHLKEGRSEWDIEVLTSDEIRGITHITYALNQVVLDYRDGMRRGKQVIEVLENPLRMVVKPGDASAIYPDSKVCNPNETVLCL